MNFSNTIKKLQKENLELVEYYKASLGRENNINFNWKTATNEQNEEVDNKAIKYKENLIAIKHLNNLVNELATLKK